MLRPAYMRSFARIDLEAVSWEPRVLLERLVVELCARGQLAVAVGR